MPFNFTGVIRENGMWMKGRRKPSGFDFFYSSTTIAPDGQAASHALHWMHWSSFATTTLSPSNSKTPIGQVFTHVWQTVQVFLSRVTGMSSTTSAESSDIAAIRIKALR
jgi:hypothetical protein